MQKETKRKIIQKEKNKENNTERKVQRKMIQREKYKEYDTE